MLKVQKKKKKRKPLTNKRAGYVRLSEEDGTGNESVSIANQRRLIQQYADEHGYEITEFYIDDDYTGVNFKRPGFERLMQDIESGEVEGFIVKDLSRLGRHNGRVQILIEELRLNGVEFISIGDNYNNLIDEDLLIGMKGLVNELYVKDISKKIRQTIYSKQKDGQWISNIPYGYRKDYTKKHGFMVDPVTSLNVKRIFSLYIEGHGTQAIAKMFNDEKIPTPMRALENIRLEAGLPPTKRKIGDLWSSTAIKRIISNEFCIGTLVQRKCDTLGIHGKTVMRDESEHIIFEDHHEPIIDKETFYLANRLRNERALKHQHKGIRKNFNLFTGMAVCGNCGKPMTPRSGVHKRRYYVCSTYNAFGAKYCNNNRIYEYELEEFIKIYLRQCRKGLESAIKNLDHIIKREIGQIYGSNSIDTLSALQKEYENNSKELRGLMEQKVKDIISNPAMKDIIEESYQKAINDKSNYLQSLKTQINEQESASKSSKDIKDGLNRALILFDEIIATDRLTVKQIKLLIEKIVVKYNNGVDVYMNGNLNEVMDTHVDISLSAVDIYAKAVIDTVFEVKEFFLQDLHKEVAKKGYKESYYRKFMPIINKMVDTGIIIRTPKAADKNYVNGTIEDAYLLFNLYTEGYMERYARISDVSFVGLSKISKWAARLSTNKYQSQT